MNELMSCPSFIGSHRPGVTQCKKVPKRIQMWLTIAKNWPKMTHNYKNGHKIAISPKLEVRIAGVAIIYWIPWIKAATVQKST